MKSHNGIKSHDLLILLYIAEYCENDFRVMNISQALKISQSEISESLNRSKIGKLIGQNKNIFRKSLYELLIFAVKHIFPVTPGNIVRGVATSHSASPLSELIISGKESYVWQYANGNDRGMSIKPLYKTVPEISEGLPKLMEILTLIDALRIGKAREVNLARIALEERLLKND